MKGNKYDALLTVTEDSLYIVRRGSKVAENWQEWIGRKDIAEKSGKVGDNCILLEHVEFHAISAAAKFIKGCSTSGADIVNPKNLAHDIAKDDREISDMREAESARHLELLISKKQGYETICVKNRISKSVLEGNPGLLSTKEEKGEAHGIGILRIKEITESCHGMYDVYEMDGFFCVAVFIPE